MAYVAGVGGGLLQQILHLGDAGHGALLVQVATGCTAHAYGTDPDLARCAQRCVDLASGRYDALSGGYFELPDDLDAALTEKAAA